MIIWMVRAIDGRLGIGQCYVSVTRAALRLG